MCCMEKSRFLYRLCCLCFLFYRKFFYWRNKNFRQDYLSRKEETEVCLYEKVVSLGKKSGKIRNRTESRNVFFSFFSVPLEKCSLSMDRFFCVSTGFFRWKSIFHLFPSCCIRKSLPVFFLRVYVSFSFYVCEYMRAHTRPREIHNVGLFPSVFPLSKKCPHTIGSYSVIYKNSSKFPQKSIA